MSVVLRMGTRGSLLARRQSDSIAQQIEQAHPGVRVERVIFTTTGDRIQDKPLHDLGGKGLFTKEIEEALLAGEIDFIVHSCKDVPVTMPLVDPANLAIAAVPTREDPRDAIVSPLASTIADLPANARVGTGSLRRRCQLLALRGDLRVEPLRGNIDTRLRRATEGDFDAVILAMAGLKRADLADALLVHPIDVDQMLPAAGQGALMIQCRADDARARSLLAVLNDPATEQAVRLERAVVAALHGDCHSPIAVLAEIGRDGVTLRATVGARGGDLPTIHARAAGPCDDALAALLLLLHDQHARELLGTV